MIQGEDFIHDKDLMFCINLCEWLEYSRLRALPTISHKFHKDKGKFMLNEHWQLTNPLDAIVFDCDGTLSFLEGIDELAERNGVGEEVSQLTQKAMNETGLNPELYEKRMQKVRPSRQQLIELGQNYYLNRSPHCVEVLSILKKLGKELYVVSGGLNPAVKLFCGLLGIPEKNIFAVDTHFDEEGHYAGYDRKALLIQKDGKRKIMEQLLNAHSRILLMGDGMNDREAAELVERFVGYGGAFYRENVKKLCDFYLTCTSFAPLLPLALTSIERDRLLEADRALYDLGLQSIALPIPSERPL
jgi:phosphoserine phosphatase